MRGNIVVGLIVFAILITIQFIVIATGAQRVAEVAARFTLDAMPGKQMAIDADVHAGALDAEGARRKRARVQREADFYAAMDGAGKFVKGDAIAALVIVALNLAGGLVVGVVYHGMGPLEALGTFAILSIGNALVTTLPAFLISTSMGLMVTRVAGEGALGVDLAAQTDRAARCAAHRRRLDAAAGVRSGVAGAGRSWRSALARSARAQLVGDSATQARRRSAMRARRAPARRRSAGRRRRLALVGVDALSIDVGTDLYALLAPPNADALLDRIGDVRRALAAETGIVIPGRALARRRCARRRHLCDPRARRASPAKGGCGSTRLLAVARRRGARRRSTASRAASRSTACGANGSRPRTRERAQPAARSSSMRSRSSARISPRSCARTRPNCSGAKSSRRCSNICARPCRRS